MKVSDLIRLRARLVSLSKFSMDNSLTNLCNELGVEANDAIIARGLDNINNFVNATLSDLNSGIELRAKMLIENLDYTIKGMVPPYESGSCFNMIPELERIYRPFEPEQTVISAITKYSNWKFPALELFPHDGQYTKIMVGNDPLYMADTNDKYLASSVEQFSVPFQRKIRSYKIDGADDLSNLPQGQFGLVLCMNSFNFMIPQEINLYLTRVYDLLSPGGVFIFQYNDAHTVDGAEKFEEGRMVFTPREMIMSFVTDIGFAEQELIQSTHSIMVVAKPGTLTTIKMHPVLGKILYK